MPFRVTGMRIGSHILQFILAALIVVILGGLAGWYYFVQREIRETGQIDAARGLGAVPSFSGSTGSNSANFAGGPVGEGAVSSERDGQKAPRLWRITRNPVAGFGFAGNTNEVFFAEMSTGNVLRADPATSAIVRLTNTLFPKTFDAEFARDGSVVLRLIGESGAAQAFAGILSTSTLSVDSTTTPMALSGVFLPSGITDLEIREPHALVFLQENPGGATVIESDWRGASQKKLLTSHLSSWRLHLRGGTLYLVQEPSDGAVGF